MDDTHAMSFKFSWKRRIQRLGVKRFGEPVPFLERTDRMLPNTTDRFGRSRMPANMTNDYLIDRDTQHTISYSGISSIFAQDSAVTESMGEISDRTLEHRAPSDRMIVVTRRRLLEVVRCLRREWRAAGASLPSP
jgi:phthalate 4,5-dioxygenase